MKKGIALLAAAVILFGVGGATAAQAQQAPTVSRGLDVMRAMPEVQNDILCLWERQIEIAEEHIQVPGLTGIVTYRDQNGAVIQTGDRLATGMTVNYEENGEITDTLHIVVMMDADGNGRITSADARIALRMAAGLEDYDRYQRMAADVNGDGKVHADDARTLLRISARLESPQQTARATNDRWLSSRSILAEVLTETKMPIDDFDTLYDLLGQALENPLTPEQRAICEKSFRAINSLMVLDPETMLQNGASQEEAQNGTIIKLELTDDAVQNADALIAMLAENGNIAYAERDTVQYINLDS
ncbi:MAG: dockerin type I repeat-containing protein [Clostridia bacterium]|nr:dockerin type I repeat-containing protein [Clostridia bacterium]